MNPATTESAGHQHANYHSFATIHSPGTDAFLSIRVKNVININTGAQCASGRCVLYLTVTCIEFDSDSTRIQWDPIFGEPVSDNVGLYRLRCPSGLMVHPGGRNRLHLYC